MCLFLSVIKFTREILPWVIMIVSWLSYDICIFVITLTLKKNKHVLLQVLKLLKRKCYNKDTCSARHLQSKYWKQMNYFSKWSNGSIATCTYLWTVQQWKNFMHQYIFSILTCVCSFLSVLCIWNQFGQISGWWYNCHPDTQRSR